ncbi:molybdopterin/thiamine biosynthesis adenylyltransferase [Hamadaea flava]|uniref:HesA/MoeB/ThiF family protein n=1 Tax=Hamadaea flava TaxID=1742688 RepID=A0ABV8LNM2_9ACTN|nr:ThiF family adenylyltransferase [Hamadaea flava]MCP2329671.1 molybdopterin/thiamine biosynthesis adenylyltransferase [Hamadaea flava]
MRRPRLKAIVVQSSGSQVMICRRALERIYLDDPSGAVATLLQVLAEGRHEVNDLPAAMAARGAVVSEAEIAAALDHLDGLEILEEACGDDRLDDATRLRHASNLRFYDLFARMDRTSADIHTAVATSRVLLLGAGGLGSGVLQALVGLGVGEITLVDDDVVEVKNLARQFVYGLAALGKPKVYAARDWVEGYSPGTRVTAVQRRVADVASIRDLAAGCDVVVCAADSPADLHLLVNEACFAVGIPFVAGGLAYSTLSYWSVSPGHTPCRLCLELNRADEAAELPAWQRDGVFIDPPRVNRATGPVVQIISGLMAMEAMRYVTRTDAPIAAATYNVIELADGMTTSRSSWARHPRCGLCAGSAVPLGAGTAAATSPDDSHAGTNATTSRDDSHAGTNATTSLDDSHAGTDATMAPDSALVAARGGAR